MTLALFGTNVSDSEGFVKGGLCFWNDMRRGSGLHHHDCSGCFRSHECILHAVQVFVGWFHITSRKTVALIVSKSVT